MSLRKDVRIHEQPGRAATRPQTGQPLRWFSGAGERSHKRGLRSVEAGFIERERAARNETKRA